MRPCAVPTVFGIVVMASTACGGAPASPSSSPLVPPPSQTSSCSGFVRDCTVRAYRVGGIALDEEGRAVTGATVSVFPFVFGGNPTSKTATTDARGSYQIEFEAMQDSIGSVGYVGAQRDGYQRDGHILRPGTDILQNLRLYRIRRVTAGEAVAVTVLPNDPPCGFDDEWVCRIFRLTAASSGRLQVSLEKHTGGPSTGLEVSIAQPPGTPFRPICCSHEVSVPVSAGQEISVSVLAVWTTTETHSFTLRTSLDAD